MRLSAALQQFHADNARYPSEVEGLNALVVRPGDLASWRGPYIEPSIRPDPWGKPYLYRRTHNGWLIVSTGPDGVEGTTDDITQSLPAPSARGRIKGGTD
jgi:general secretion pathway protein G